jgi:hypothetical protein
MRTNEQLLAAINAQNVSTGTIRTFVALIVAVSIASGSSSGSSKRLDLLQGAMVAVAGSVLGSARLR